MIKGMIVLFVSLLVVAGMPVTQAQVPPPREVMLSEPLSLGRALDDVRGVRDVGIILGNAPQLEIRLPAEAADEVLGYRYAPAFFRLLLSEELGFLIQEVRTDEGIKHKEDYSSLSELLRSEGTVIARRSSTVDPITVLVRVINDLSSGHLSLMAPFESNTAEELPARGWSRAVVWAVMLAALVVLILPLQVVCERFVPQLVRGGIALSFVLSLFLITYLAWLFQALGSFPGTAVGLWTFLLLLGQISWRKRDRLFKEGRGKRFVLTTILFVMILALLVFLRSLHPEIHWGEKPMDFAFLNYFRRLEELPPHDPWAAGNLMQYYYFGYYALGQLLKITGVSPAFGYNLGIATLGAWMVLAAYGGLRILGVSRLAALVGAIAISCLSNAEWFWLLLVDGRKIDFDTFWATTRVLSSPSITEYPFWSQLFADFHPHVIGQPILTIGLALVLWFGMIRTATEVKVREGCFISLILGTVLALLYLINSWDALSMAYCAAAVGVCGGLTACGVPSWRDRGRRVIRYFVVVVGAVATMSLLILPHILLTGRGPKLWSGFVTGAEFNRVGPVLRHLGLWLLPIIAAIVTSVSAEHFKQCSVKKTAIALFIGLCPIGLGIWGLFYGVYGTPWLLFFTLGLGLVCAVYTLFMAVEPIVRVAGAAVFVALSLMSIVETFFLFDRMNTVFKFYQSVWLLWGIAAICVVVSTLKRLRVGGRVVRRRVFGALTFCCFLLGVIGSVFGIVALVSVRRVEGPRPTLDGVAYLHATYPEDAKMVRWINSNIHGTPTMVEAWGPSYQDYARFSMYTGIPVVVGWDYHIQQRGTQPQEVERRKYDVREFYTTLDWERARAIALNYRIQYVIVGDIERRAYGESGLNKFEQGGGLFFKVARFGTVALYSVALPPPSITGGPS